MMLSVLLALLGLELKHFLADYVFQTGKMIAEKGNVRLLGGYAHAGLHVLGTAVVLLWLVPVNFALAGVLLAEFIVHYAIDYTKVRRFADVKITEKPKLFWVLHGLDQLLHQLTYLAIITYVASATSGAVA